MKEPTMSEQEFKKAQVFEWKETRNHLQKMMKDHGGIHNILLDLPGDPSDIPPSNQFFLESYGGCKADYPEFVEYIKDKTLLDVGGSFASLAAKWTYVKRRILIDPLIDQINAFIKENGRHPWYDAANVIQYSSPAEELLFPLVDSIDGCIYSRNCLNHTQNAWKILDNIAEYAMEGCYLLLWNQTWYDGYERGHCNMTRNPQEVEDYIISKGFKIINRIDDNAHRSRSQHLRPDQQYGCVARKIR